MFPGLSETSEIFPWHDPNYWPMSSSERPFPSIFTNKKSKYCQLMARVGNPWNCSELDYWDWECNRSSEAPACAWQVAHTGGTLGHAHVSRHSVWHLVAFKREHSGPVLAGGFKWSIWRNGNQWVGGFRNCPAPAPSPSPILSNIWQSSSQGAPSVTLEWIFIYEVTWHGHGIWHPPLASLNPVKVVVVWWPVQDQGDTKGTPAVSRLFVYFWEIYTLL